MVSIALLGFGTVGSGVAEVLTDNKELIKKRTGLDIDIKYILDLREFPEHPLGNRIVHDISVILNDPEISIVVEMMGGVHPAYDFSIAAIKAGKNVVTSNKAVVAEYGPELLSEASSRGLRYLFEASVGGGIPIIRPLTELSAENDISEIVGILNGTTNYILTAMKERGVSFEEALKNAQSLGYAEADPTADVDGYDTCRKICILSAVAFGNLVNYENVKTVGIRNVTLDDINRAEADGCSVKLIARALKLGDKVMITVEPYLVKNSCPLSSISDVFNGILVKGQVCGELMFYGKGAGKLPTAGAVVSDIIDIASRGDNQPLQSVWSTDSSLLISSLPSGDEDKSLSELGRPLN